MKEFKINHLLSNVMQNNIRGIAFSFWLAFLHDTETCSLKFNSWSTLTYRNFSYLLILTVSLPIFIWKLSLVLFMSKWYLSGFVFILLSLNYYNRFSAAFFNLIRTSEMLKPVQYGVLSSAYFATGVSWRNKKRSQKNISSEKGPSTDLWGTPSKMSICSLQVLFRRTLCYENNKFKDPFLIP